MVMCPRCGRANEGKYRFCLGCGAVLPAQDQKIAPAVVPSGAAAPRQDGRAGADALSPPPATPIAPGPGPRAEEPKTEAPRTIAPVLPPRPSAASSRGVAPPSAGHMGPSMAPSAPPPAPRLAGNGSDELPTAAVSSLLQQVAARTAGAPPPHNPPPASRPPMEHPGSQAAAIGLPTPRIATGPNHNPVEAAALAQDMSANTLQSVPRPVPSSEAKTVPPGSTLPGFQLAPGASQPPQRPTSPTPSARPPASRYAPPAPPAGAAPALRSTPAGAPAIPPLGAPRNAPPAGFGSGGVGPGMVGGHSCGTCGADVPEGNAFCGSCGAPNPQRAAPVAPVAHKPERVGFIALIDDNGAESLQFPLMKGENRVGSGESCQLRFPDDGFLAGVHCAVDAEVGHASLRPIDQANGVFVRITVPVELHHGDVLRIGQEVLRFERMDRLVPEKNADGQQETVGSLPAKGVWGRLCQLGLARQVANAYLLSSPDVFLGRERGDILFPRDGFVSGSHAVLSDRNGRGFLKDLVSSNGTFVKAKGETVLRNGDLFLLGRNLLRIHLGAPA